MNGRVPVTIAAIINNRFRDPDASWGQFGAGEWIHLGNPVPLLLPCACLAPPHPGPGLELISPL